MPGAHAGLGTVHLIPPLGTHVDEDVWGTCRFPLLSSSYRHTSSMVQDRKRPVEQGSFQLHPDGAGG